MRGILLPVLLTLIIFGIGCGSADIVTPGNTPDSKSVNTSSVNRMLWGVWDIEIDPVNSTAQVKPLRSGTFTCNVTKFLQPPLSPIHLLSIEFLPGSDPINGYFELDISIRHPFPGANRFNGFDVRGILLSDGTQPLEIDPSAIIAGDGETHLKNADGYTRWWNYPEFTSYGTIFGFTNGVLGPPNHPSATVNPYKYFADGFGSDSMMTELDTTNRGMFSTNPGVNSRQYNIQFKMDGGDKVLDFQYAIDASWSQPDDSYDPDYPPEAFPISANMAEPFMIICEDAGSTAWYVDPDHHGGQLVLDISVFDWQGLNNPDGAYGEFGAIWLESSMLGTLVDAKANGSVISSNDISATIRITLSDLNLTKSGQEFLYILVPSVSPSTYQPQVDGGEFFDYPDTPLTSYFLASVVIDDEEPWQPGPGKITWVSWQDGNPEIYRMQGDGTSPQRLTNYGDHDWEPKWSPDGTQIAWRRGGYGDANIWIMDEDGSNAEQITFDGWNFDPTWHPDGEWLYYWTYDGEGDAGNHIWKVRTDGSEQQQVTFFDEGTWAAPTFNPAGDLIALEGPGPGGGPRDIWTVKPDGTDPLHLTETSLWDASPCFSADGQRILYCREDPQGEFKQYMMDLEGGNLEQVTYPEDGHDDFSGCFGLYDQYVIVQRRMGNHPDFDEIVKYVMGTGELIQLTDNDSMDQYPDWHPND